MWKDKILLWESTEHEWDEFGINCKNDIDDENSDELERSYILTYKEQTLEEFIFKIVYSALGFKECINEINILKGFALVGIALNLFNIDISIIENDNDAKVFLNLLHVDQETGKHFFFKKELKKYKVIDPILNDFKAKGILEEKNKRIFIKGKVLSKAHIKK